jgi:alpha-N-arabinofuranosidase
VQPVYPVHEEDLLYLTGSLMKNRLKKTLKIAIGFGLILPLWTRQSLFAQIEYTINPSNILHTVDKKVYGHFLEHIYHSVNGGLWGEMIWNRSLERYAGGGGIWKTENDEVVQTSLSENVRLLFGETAWKDTEFTLQAKKDGGSEGFLIIFRANGENFYWCNLGGWGNTRHAIEKGTPGVRWGVFGSQINGSIQSGQWYDIRVRCEGNHFQVWLNGEKLFDFTDSAAHLSGQPGVGTWATQARYRNFLVTDLTNGDTLFQGIPDISGNEVTLINWNKIGTVSTFGSEAALNSNYALKCVKTETGEAGIQQRLLNLKTQTYFGSFWAKGNMPGNLKLSLLKGTEIIAQQTFSPPTADWQEYKFELVPSLETTNGTLRISFGDTGTVCLDQISMMGQDAAGNDGFRPDLFHAIEALKPPIIRWPGGYFAEFYRWKSGIGPQHERVVYPMEAWDDQDVNSFGTDEFMTLCHRLGAEPIIVINIGHRESAVPEPFMIEEAQQWVEYCNGPVTSEWGAKRASNGHPEPYGVKYWEISNEVWLARNATTYVNFLKAFVPALKAIDPDIRIIACGSGSYDQDWNCTILNNCAELIDYISTHHYEEVQNYITGVARYGNFLGELVELIAASDNPEIKIYMSEWNFWNGIDWRNGLYTGGMLNMFERNGKTFEIGGPALFLRHSSASGWNNALINFDHYRWFPATNYVVMKFWHDHYAPNFIEMTGGHSALNAVATLSEDGQVITIKCVNVVSADLEAIFNIDVSFTPLSASVELIAPGSLSAQNSMANPNCIQIEPDTAQVDGHQVRANIHGNSTTILTITKNPASTIDQSNKNRVNDFFLYANHPNPFNPLTNIGYDLPESTHVQLRIIDVMGREVSTLIDETREAGHYETVWDGTDRDGFQVGSGLYFYELSTQSSKRIRKMVLVR